MVSTRTWSETEVIIAAAWSQVLQVDVGPDDNFFDVGGDSARMLQIRDLLQARFRREVSMIDLFEYPTVGELASFLLAQPAPSSAQHAIERRAARRRQAFGLGAEAGNDE